VGNAAETHGKFHEIIDQPSIGIAEPVCAVPVNVAV
jgi:hypothetical protein